MQAVSDTLQAERAIPSAGASYKGKDVMMRKWVLACAVIILLWSVAGAQGTAPKMAIHVEKYAERVCHADMPDIAVSGINSTYPGVGRINAFVVLFDYEEVHAVAFGLAWPETWMSPMWQDCGALRVGAIHNPGDQTNIMLEECAKGGEPVIVGWLSVTVTAPGVIEILPSEGDGAVAIVDCDHVSPKVSEVMFTGKAGAGGVAGTDLSRFMDMKNRNWHIRPDSTGDALSITHAMRQAIPGDTVFAAGGTYRETVYMRNGVVLLGSWDSGFTGRDLMKTPSTIVPAGDHGICVVAGLSEDSTCVIDGFVITGGRGHYGGGMALRQGASPTLRNLIIYGNKADMGGGIFCHSSSPLIEDVLIVANEAPTGAGIACTMGAAPRIVRATIAANSGGTGAGIFARGAAPYVERSIIADHEDGDGIYCEDKGSRITFSCCDFWANKPSNFGGYAAAEMGLRDNIFVDPLFEDVGSLDFGLSPGSPCRDAGVCGKIGSRWVRPPEK
jgi:hypothetical protein